MSDKLTILAWAEPWNSHGWRNDFVGSFYSVEEAMCNRNAEAICVIKKHELWLVRVRLNGQWVERDELVEGAFGDR